MEKVIFVNQGVVDSLKALNEELRFGWKVKMAYPDTVTSGKHGWPTVSNMYFVLEKEDESTEVKKK